MSVSCTDTKTKMFKKMPVRSKLEYATTAYVSSLEGTRTAAREGKAARIQSNELLGKERKPQTIHAGGEEDKGKHDSLLSSLGAAMMFT